MLRLGVGSARVRAPRRAKHKTKEVETSAQSFGDEFGVKPPLLLCVYLARPLRLCRAIIGRSQLYNGTFSSSQALWQTSRELTHPDIVSLSCA